jgi:hypothetical protein
MTQVYLLFLISLCQKNDRLGAFLTVMIGWTASIVSSLLHRYQGLQPRIDDEHQQLGMTCFDFGNYNCRFYCHFIANRALNCVESS